LAPGDRTTEPGANLQLQDMLVVYEYDISERKALWFANIAAIIAYDRWPPP
jgi:hypothetical protein